CFEGNLAYVDGAYARLRKESDGWNRLAAAMASAVAANRRKYDFYTGFALRSPPVAQVSRIHHHCRLDAGIGHRRQRGSFCSIKRCDPAPAEGASSGKPLPVSACERLFRGTIVSRLSRPARSQPQL